MQSDGNLVVYDLANRPVFASGTHGNPGAFLSCQDDGTSPSIGVDNRRIRRLRSGPLAHSCARTTRRRVPVRVFEADPAFVCLRNLQSGRIIIEIVTGVAQRLLAQHGGLRRLLHDMNKGRPMLPLLVEPGSKATEPTHVVIPQPSLRCTAGVRAGTTEAAPFQTG